MDKALARRLAIAHTNAGNACVVDGRKHGFHGDASLSVADR